ncbi:MAG: penicillin-binding protein [Parcubacteria group bacterium Gr01-1014_30]|nr:MAG: penicillin-binding protein [Parcubacteria group bacterium Gr01-1014_30]
MKISRTGLLLFTVLVLALFVYYGRSLPRPEKFTERTLAQSTKIYDRSGEVLLYEIYGEEKRTWASLSEMPKHLIEAVIAAEDINFYKHFGLDFRGILRSIPINIRLGSPVYGGSTISQQLIRSTFLTLEKTPERKIREVILTLEMERRYSKDQILEWYLNQIPLGQNAYGMEAASQTYFQKSVREITLSEAATLAALIQAPSFLSPYGQNLQELVSKKNVVLARMARVGFLTQNQAQQAKAEELQFAKASQPIKAPHFTLWVKDWLEEKYGEAFLREKGLKVYTSLDWELQEAAEKAVANAAQRNTSLGAYNAAIVATDPNSGEVLAMVGSKDWFGDPWPKGCVPGKNCLFEPYPNVVLRSRQPGSAFKPFVYVTAFQKGYDADYEVVDEETNFGLWGGKPYIPKNYDGRFRGPVTLRQGLAQSLNVPSVKVLADLAGLQDSINMAQNFGITTLTQPPSFYGLSIVLGGGEVRLLDMVSAYGVFATAGLQVAPLAVLRIEDSQGNVIEQNQRTPKRVIEREPTELISDILSDNEARTPIFGPRSVMYFENYKVSAKTGTTQDFKDGWILGYTPSIVAGVWVGNNDNTPMRQEPGIVLAGPIWRTFMEKALSR